MTYKEPKNEGYKLSPFWVSAIAKALARQHRVEIRRGDNWALDPVNKVLIYTDDISYLTKDSALALLLHEIGHLRFTDPFNRETALFKKYPEVSQMCINACEDIRIDFKMSREYEGAMSLIDALHDNSAAVGLNKLAEHLEKVKENKEKMEEFKKHLAMNEAIFKKGGVSRAEMDKWIAENEPQITGEMNPVAEVMYAMLSIYYGYGNHPTILKYPNPVIIKKAYECLDEVIKEDVEMMENTPEVETFYEEKIYPIIKDLIQHNPDGSEKKFKKDGGDGQGQGQSKNQKGQGDGKNDGKGSPDMSRAKEMTQALKDRAKEKVEQALGGKQPSHDKSQGFPIDYKQFYDEIRDGVNTAASRFARILKDNKFDRYAGRFRTGELNKKRLFKFKAQDFRIFQRRTERKNKDYAFSVMLDTSGSMDGRQIVESMKGIVLMSEVFNKCGVPFEVRFFSGDYRAGKTFDQKFSRNGISKAASAVWGGGTEISRPFKEAFKELDARKEQHKIMVVLTDGEVFDHDADMMRKTIGKNDHVNFYGIGIGVDLKKIFKDGSIKVNDAREIFREFERIIKRHIKIG